jgi:hypothetical protein
MIMFLLSVGVPLGIFTAVYAWAKANDDPAARQSRDFARYSLYSAQHRHMRSVWQRAGHVYEGNEHGPFGVAVVVTGIIFIAILGLCEILQGQFPMVSLFLYAIWINIAGIFGR